MKETQALSLSQEDPLEEEMATHSSILAWKIRWTVEADGLQSMGLQRVLLRPFSCMLPGTLCKSISRSGVSRAT